MVGYGLAYATVPHLINYQGRLTDKDNKPLEGNYTITFRIYDAESGGNMLWDEMQTVQIQKGIFNILLGSVANLGIPFDKAYFLEIKVGDEVMTPRQRITSAAYSLRAESITDETKLVPKGAIIMWTGSLANIPQGWALCDGTNGTPDLRDKFVKGIPTSSTNPGVAGGSSSHNHGGATATHVLTINEMPSHNHVDSFSDVSTFGGTWGGGHSTSNSADGGSWYDYTGSTGGGAGHDHSISSASSLPPYYELAFIMKL